MVQACRLLLLSGACYVYTLGNRFKWDDRHATHPPEQILMIEVTDVKLVAVVSARTVKINEILGFTYML